MDTVETVTTAQSPEVFDVLSFVEETAYPTEFVTIFRDIAAAHNYAKLVEERAQLDVAGEDPGDHGDLDQAIDALAETLKKGALTFELRGFAPGVLQKILKEHNNEDDENSADPHVIAKTIVRVRNASGAVDEHLWSAEEVTRLKDNLAEGEYYKLLEAVGSVVFNATVFDKAVDAGFPRGSVDVA